MKWKLGLYRCYLRIVAPLGALSVLRASWDIRPNCEYYIGSREHFWEDQFLALAGLAGFLDVRTGHMSMGTRLYCSICNSL